MWRYDYTTKCSFQTLSSAIRETISTTNRLLDALIFPNQVEQKQQLVKTLRITE